MSFMFNPNESRGKTDGEKLNDLLKAGKLDPTRLTDKGRAAILDYDIQSGSRSLDRLTDKGVELLSKHNMPSVAPLVAEAQKKVQLAQSFRTSAPEPTPSVGERYRSWVDEEARKAEQRAQSLKEAATRQAANSPTLLSNIESGAWDLGNAEMAKPPSARSYDYVTGQFAKGILSPAPITKIAEPASKLESVAGTVAGAAGQLMSPLWTATKGAAMAGRMALRGTSDVAQKALGGETQSPAEAIAGVAIPAAVGAAADIVGPIAQRSVANTMAKHFPLGAALPKAVEKAVPYVAPAAVGGLVGATQGTVRQVAKAIRGEDVNIGQAVKEVGAEAAVMAGVNTVLAALGAAPKGKTADYYRFARTLMDNGTNVPDTWAQFEQMPGVEFRYDPKSATVQYQFTTVNQGNAIVPSFMAQAPTQSLPSVQDLRKSAAERESLMLNLEIGDKVSVEGLGGTYTVAGLPKSWIVQVRDNKGNMRHVAKDNLGADLDVLKARQAKTSTPPESRTSPVEPASTPNVGSATPYSPPITSAVGEAPTTPQGQGALVEAPARVGRFEKGNSVEVQAGGEWKTGIIREVDAKPYKDSGVRYDYKVSLPDGGEIFVNRAQVRIPGGPKALLAEAQKSGEIIPKPRTVYGAGEVVSPAAPQAQAPTSPTPVPESEGQTLRLYRGEVAPSEVAGTGRNIPKGRTITDIVGGAQQILERNRRQLAENEATLNRLAKQREDLAGERPGDLWGEEAGNRAAELSKLDERIRFAENDVRSKREVVAKLESQVRDEAEINDIASRSDLLYLTSQEETARSYASPYESPNAEALLGAKPEGYKPTVRAFDVTPNKVLDLTGIGESGTLRSWQDFQNALSTLGVPESEWEKIAGNTSWDEMEGTPGTIYQLFRGRNLPTVVDAVKRQGYDAIHFTEGKQDNWIVLDRGVVREVGPEGAATPAPPQGQSRLTEEEQSLYDALYPYRLQAKADVERLINQEVSYLKSTMGQGVEPGGLIRDADGTVTGRFGRQSRNDTWYSDFYAQKGRKPTQKELREIAETRLREGGEIGRSGETIPPNEDYLEAMKVVNVLSELEAKKTSSPAGRVAAAQVSGDALKGEVAKLVDEQAIGRAAAARFGDEGFVAKQVMGIANLIGESRAKGSAKVSDPDVEKVLSATKTPATLAWQAAAKAREIGEGVKDIFSYEHRIAHMPKFQEEIREFQGVQKDAQAWALETYLAIVSPTENPEGFATFSKLIALRDMLEDVRSGKEVAGALAEEQLVKAETELMTKASPGVQQALRNHDRIMQAAWKELQRRGKVSQDAPGKEHYYPHKIMDYAREIDRSFPGLGRKLKAPYRYYMKKREGTTRLFDTDYLTITMNHLAKLYIDNATDDFATDIAKEYDVWPKLSQEERARFGERPEAGRLYEIGGERYFGWRYDPLHRADSPIVEALQGPLLDADPNANRFLNSVHVLPEAVADRLDRLKEPGVNSRILSTARTAQFLWKNVVLGPFGAGIPWQVGNFIGDSINLFREDPAALLFIPKGWQAAGQYQKGVISPKFQDMLDAAIETRVVEAAYSRKGGLPYDPMLAKLQPTRYLLNRLNPFEGWANLSERRELTVRLAKFMADYERISRGEMPKAAMFDVQKLSDAGLTPTQIAGKASREFGVDYGKLTPEGKAVVRDLILPFSTFYIQNFQNWANYVRRNPGAFGLKFLLPLTALAAWNAVKFPEEEEKLPAYYRLTPHLITGYKTEDGKPIIISMQTPIDMAAKMVGLDVTADLARQVISGTKDIDAAAKELAVSVGLAIPRQMWNLFNVFPKSAIEAAMNKNTFTGAPIVSEDIKDTPEGVRARLNYVVQQWFTPYGTYTRAARDLDEPTKAFGEFAKQGPADIKRALGIREVDLEREALNRFYDKLEAMEGEYAVWKDKPNADKLKRSYEDYATLKWMRAASQNLSDQWKMVRAVKDNDSLPKAERDKRVRELYKSMAKMAETVMGFDVSQKEKE